MKTIHRLCFLFEATLKNTEASLSKQKIYLLLARSLQFANEQEFLLYIDFDETVSLEDYKVISMNKTAAKQTRVDYREKSRESQDTVSNQTGWIYSEIKEKFGGQESGNSKETNRFASAKEKTADAACKIQEKSNQIRGVSDEITEKTAEKASLSGFQAKNVLNSSTEHIKDFDLRGNKPAGEEKKSEQSGSADRRRYIRFADRSIDRQNQEV